MELQEQDSQGTFTSPDPRMDILATALGRPDYPGRVVGEPGRVTARNFFGKKSRTKTPRETPEEMEARLNAKFEGAATGFDASSS